MLRVIPLLFIGLFLPSFFLMASESDEPHDMPDISEMHSGTSASLSVEELTKTEALQLFLLHKYEESLAEFETLASQYPDDILIKRYKGACLSELRRDDEAFIVFNEILETTPKDLPTHKLLAKMRLRRGEPEQAKERLEKLVEYDSEGGKFAAYAKAQLEKLKTIAEADRSGRALAASQMGAEEFMKTKAVILFMDAEYEKSVKEFEALETRFPKDVMAKRYKGIALDKLGRYEEAAGTFRAGLEVSPDNAALRYALAQTLFHQKDLKASAEELRQISRMNVRSDYTLRADGDLEAIERIEAVRLKAEKKWLISFEQGFEFNSNAASEPKKRQVPAEEHAIRWPGSLYASAQLRRDDPWTLSASYLYAHSLYSDTLDYLNTMVHAPTLTLSHMGSVAGKPFVTMFSSSYVHVSVEEEFYYQSYPQTLRLITSWWDWHRIIFSEKIAYTDYKDQGSNPMSTSRESVSNAVNVTNNFYFNQKKDLYLGAGYEFKVEDTDGSDYVRNIHQINTDFNFPLWLGWSGFVSFRYKNSDYPETTLSVQRQDEEYLVDTRITVPMTENTSLKFFYGYLNNDSNDPNYNYVNHSGGASIVRTF